MIDQDPEAPRSVPSGRFRPGAETPKVAAVTGAAAGVGRAVVHRFAREGACIGLIARDEAALEDVRREVQDLGGQALVLALDVADPDAVFEAASKIEAAFGPIDVWVNDAMTTVFSPLEKMTPAEFRRVTEVTYLGFVHGTMAALKAMKPRDRGVIVQVGSALAYRGIPLQSAYCGAKHAIRGFSDSLRTELMHDGSKIRVTVVELPAVNTPQFDWARTHMAQTPRPMGEVFEPEAAAEAVFRAARGRWREYWLGRTTIMTILGEVVLPGVLDRMLAKSAVKGQGTGEPASPLRIDNLYRPITALHRTRGSFEAEAHARAVLIPGPVARIGVVAAGALAFAAAGFGLARAAMAVRRTGA